VESSLGGVARGSGIAVWLVPLLVGVGCATAPPIHEQPAIRTDAADGAPVPDEDSLDAAPLVAEALSAVESAEALWQEGDLEGSLATLDLAYELLLQIPDAPGHMQEKDDLRQLVSRQVVEIYRSRRTRSTSRCSGRSRASRAPSAASSSSPTGARASTAR